MSKFSPAEIDAFLDAKAQHPVATDVPEGFFENMEERILSAVSAEAKPTPSVSIKPRQTRRLWMSGVAAAVLILLCTTAIKYSQHITVPASPQNGLYTVGAEMTEGEIEDLCEMYDADLFLEEL